MLSKQIFQYYTVFCTTAMVENDIKNLKRINNLIYKFINTGKEQYRLEAINILKTFSNITKFDSNLIELIKNKIINEENYTFFDILLENI